MRLTAGLRLAFDSASAQQSSNFFARAPREITEISYKLNMPKCLLFGVYAPGSWCYFLSSLPPPISPEFSGSAETRHVDSPGDSGQFLCGMSPISQILGL